MVLRSPGFPRSFGKNPIMPYFHSVGARFTRIGRSAIASSSSFRASGVRSVVYRSASSIRYPRCRSLRSTNGSNIFQAVSSGNPTSSMVRLLSGTTTPRPPKSTATPNNFRCAADNFGLPFPNAHFSTPDTFFACSFGSSVSLSPVTTSSARYREVRASI